MISVRTVLKCTKFGKISFLGKWIELEFGNVGIGVIAFW